MDAGVPTSAEELLAEGCSLELLSGQPVDLKKAKELAQLKKEIADIRFQGLYNLVVDVLRETLKFGTEDEKLRAAATYLKHAKPTQQVTLHLTAEDLIQKMRQDPTFVPPLEMLEANEDSTV